MLNLEAVEHKSSKDQILYFEFDLNKFIQNFYFHCLALDCALHLMIKFESLDVRLEIS